MAKNCNMAISKISASELSKITAVEICCNSKPITVWVSPKSPGHGCSKSGYILSNGLIFIHWIVLVLLTVIQWIAIYLLDWGICPSNNQAQSNYAKWHELMTNSSEYGGVTLQLVNPPLITSHVVPTITLTQELSSLFIFLYKKHIHL